MCLIYLSNARLPTETAHGYQIMKMCEAFAQSGVSVRLLHPYRVQTDEMRVIRDLFNFYQVQPTFEIKTLYCWDWRAMFHNRTQRLWFLTQSVSFALHVYHYTMRWWQDKRTTFYGRDKITMVLLLKSRRFIKGRLVFEAHTFPGEEHRSRIVSLFQRLDKLIVITHQLKRLFIEAGIPEDKIIVAPDAVDLKQFQISDTKGECRQRLGLPLDRPVVGYIGRFQNAMGMEKGIPELVEAMGHLLESDTDDSPLLLCVGGPMNCVPLYEEIAKKCNVPREHLKFVDRVPTSQVPYWIRACDVVTIPWTWNEFSAYYTSPLKLFEYMAVGTPIIASDLPSLREILTDGENAVLVAPGDPEKLANGIVSVLRNQELAEKIMARATSDVLKYTWYQRAQNILWDLLER